MSSVLEINANRAGSPRGEELRAWSIVTSAGRDFLGRIAGQTDAGLVLLADPFSFESAVVIQGGKIEARRRVLPVHMLAGVVELALLPQIVIPLEKCTAGELEDLARYVAEAWAGREHIRKITSPIRVVNAGEVVGPNGKPLV